MFRITVAVSTLLLSVSLAACAADVSEPDALDEVVERIIEEGGELCEPFDYAPTEAEAGENSDGEKGAATKCGKNSSTHTSYEPPSQPIQMDVDSKEEARAACAKWAMEYGTLLDGYVAPTCPYCPDGSFGCEVVDVTTGSVDVTSSDSDAGTTYTCVGHDKELRVQYSCAPCTLDGCGE